MSGMSDPGNAGLLPAGRCRHPQTVDAFGSTHGQEEAIRFEHDIAEICDDIGQAGWTFDLPERKHYTLHCLQKRLQ